MGENEQGGILRTVVVIGIIAMIAAVVIGTVIGLNHKMNVLSTNTMNHVNRVGKPYTTGLEEMKHFDKYNDVSNWGGKWLNLPKVGNIKPNQWRECQFDLKVSMKTAISLDINAYPANQHAGGNNDWDDVRKRSVVATNANTGQSFDIVKNGNTQHFEAEPNVVYHFDVKSYNNKPYTLNDADAGGGATSAISVATHGEPFQIQVTNFEAATYSEDIE